MTTFNQMGGTIPGYTGIRQTQEIYDERAQNRVGEKKIPGKFNYHVNYYTLTIEKLCPRDHVLKA